MRIGIPGPDAKRRVSKAACASEPSAALTAMCPETLMLPALGLVAGFFSVVSLQLASKGIKEACICKKYKQRHVSDRRQIGMQRERHRPQVMCMIYHARGRSRRLKLAGAVVILAQSYFVSCSNSPAFVELSRNCVKKGQGKFLDK